MSGVTIASATSTTPAATDRVPLDRPGDTTARYTTVDALAVDIVPFIDVTKAPYSASGDGDAANSYTDGPYATTDNAAAFNAAIQAAGDNGADILIPPGVYEISEPILINKSYINFHGLNRRGVTIVPRKDFVGDEIIKVRADTDVQLASVKVHSLYIYNYDVVQVAIRLDSVYEAEVYDINVSRATEAIELIGVFHSSIHDIWVTMEGAPTAVADRAAITCITRAGTRAAADYCNSYVSFENIKMDSIQPFLHVENTTAPAAEPHYMLNFRNVGLEMGVADTVWPDARNAILIKNCLYSSINNALMSCYDAVGTRGNAMIAVGDAVGGISFTNIGMQNNGATATANFDYFIDMGGSIAGTVSFNAITLFGSMRSYDVNSVGGQSNIFFNRIAGRDAVREITASSVREDWNNFETSGYPHRSWLSNTFKTGVMAADDVVTICPDDFYGTIIVSSNTLGSAVYEMLITPTLALLVNSSGTLYSATKDNASTMNLYIESNLLKIQNKTAGNVVVVVSFFLGNVY